MLCESTKDKQRGLYHQRILHHTKAAIDHKTRNYENTITLLTFTVSKKSLA